MRLLLALGGNAMTGPDGSATPEAQIAAVATVMAAVAELLSRPDEKWQVVVTHGNGPQVGNLLVKNELAASVVPPVPLDWCVAQTQATLGLIVMDALDDELAARGLTSPVVTVVTRTRVDPADEAFDKPTKPIGRYLPADEASLLVEYGETWEDRGAKGWRRVVASPEPLEILDAPAVVALVEAGFVVVANGGGGIPVVREHTRLRGIEAVIDKDLGAALLARTVAAEALLIVTDVPHALVGYGTPDEKPVGRVTVAQMRVLAGQGHFASGSMGPKVEAALRFVEQGGQYAVITDLDQIAEAAAGRSGTVIVPDERPDPTPQGEPHA